MGRRNIATIDKIALAELASEMIREKARRREHAGRPAKDSFCKNYGRIIPFTSAWNWPILPESANRLSMRDIAAKCPWFNRVDLR